MPRTRGTRPKGSGIPAKGAGWGGPAKGAGTRYVKGEVQPLQGQGHTAPVVARREARIDSLKDKLFDLAHHAEREETQLAATVAYLNREEGLPVARNITANVDDPAKVIIVTGVPRADDDRTVN